MPRYGAQPDSEPALSAFASLPRGPSPGLIPTLNRKGFMSAHLDACSQAFVDYAATAGGEALDIGCAYGIATLAALAKGARVLACDMEPGHLEVLTAHTRAADRARLRTQTGCLPDVDFPDAGFSAILCSRALHFLKGADIEASVAKFRRWLVPGGMLFLITDTPYAGYWKAHAPIYEDKKRAGDPWPGFIPDTAIYLPAPGRTGSYLNPCDPDILARVCTEAGLMVESASFIARNDGTDRPADKIAREHAAVVARAPA